MIRVNGEEQTYLDESVAELVTRLTIESRGIAVALDGEVVRRSQWSLTRVHDRCVIEILSAVAGG